MLTGNPHAVRLLPLALVGVLAFAAASCESGSGPEPAGAPVPRTENGSGTETVPAEPVAPELGCSFRYQRDWERPRTVEKERVVAGLQPERVRLGEFVATVVVREDSGTRVLEVSARPRRLGPGRAATVTRFRLPGPGRPPLVNQFAPGNLHRDVFTGTFTGNTLLSVRSSGGRRPGLVFGCRAVVPAPPLDPAMRGLPSVRCTLRYQRRAGQSPTRRRVVAVRPPRRELRFSTLRVALSLAGEGATASTLFVTVRGPRAGRAEFAPAGTEWPLPDLHLHEVANQLAPHGFTGLHEVVYTGRGGVRSLLRYSCRVV